MSKRTALWGLLLSFALSLGAAVLLQAAAPAGAAETGGGENDDKSSSMRMMERVETIVYGETGKGGLIDRLNAVEKELFGRGLPGSISERHSAILNFLEVGTADQPSMLFKLGVAEWIVGRHSQRQRAALPRVEALETELDGEMQYGKALAMRVERILASLVADPVTTRDVTLPNATVLKVAFQDELGPATTKKGDSVGLALMDDLLVSTVLVAPKGSLVQTTVSRVRQPGVFGTPSDIQFEFKSLLPLGPQRPSVRFGDIAKKATEEAQKNRDKGEGAMIGAGAASFAGAVILGPIGLPLGLLVRGNAIKIPEGSIMFLETSGDIVVSGYPIPESLRVDPNLAIRESVAPSSSSSSSTAGKGAIELPAEQKIR